jgi:glycosyltransferase involved in cell wall biosynthesis
MMSISVFTPTHNTRFIKDTYMSLVQQSVTNWEWLLLLNGNAVKNDLPADIVNDTRVKILNASVKGVGDAKGQCLKHASGKYMLELDHDDMLHPDAFAEVLKSFNTGAQFVFSNTSRITEAGEPEFTEYNAHHGWQYRPFDYKGKMYKECISFSPVPQAMSYIWYMPNHLRAFTRELYQIAGEYNTDLPVCDDQDLMQRMYIADSRFAHIDKPLYFQRIHQSQTQVVQNPLIQQKNTELYKQNISDIMLSWAKRNNLLALDMGAAHRKKPGFLGVDMYDLPHVDVVCDCNGKLPFDDNSVGVIRAVDFMEHIKDSIHLMNEFYRVLAHGGMLLSMTPSTDGRGAFQDPTHVSFWNENSFWYYTKGNIRNFVPQIKARFQPSFIETGFPNEFCRKHNIAYVTANLTAIKTNDRLPGVLEI